MAIINKTTKTLLLVSAVAVVLDFARLDLWGTSNLMYLIWNLFLAWIPYLISLYFIKKDVSTSRFVVFFVFWILFFPNAPYLVTDVLHIVSSLPTLLWYDSLLLFFFGWIGLFLGMLSMFDIHQYLIAHLGRIFSEFIIFAICFVSSFGVYLGRFERWNSWDIFVRPLYLIRDSFYISTGIAHNGTPLAFIFFFTVFMYCAYRMICVLVVNKQE
ncbi:DUF1361 domain-containing protein [Candidatus Nomurabacteria bacterium]|nr:DUF1361 domain-containing protein [Candidatus Nomurabacteria bacterium]